MRYRVLTPFRYSGRELRAGDVFEADDTYEMRGNVIAGRIVQHVESAAPKARAPEPPPVREPEPPPEPPPAQPMTTDQMTPTQRRRYTRRDMQGDE